LDFAVIERFEGPQGFSADVLEGQGDAGAELELAQARRRL